MTVHRTIFASATALGLLMSASHAGAQVREETLRFVTGGVVNTLDPTMPGATRDSFAVGMSTYDRLLAFGRKQEGDNWVFDFDNLRGELAESYSVSEDGRTITIVLRPDATFQDGSPVEARDVKWSLDRAVSAQSLAAAQFATGSITNPDQFTVIDDRTVEIALPEPDRLALPNLAVPFAIIYNSDLVSEHVTDDDPWGLEWTKDNTAGSGAYRVARHVPGQQIVLERNEDWNRGRDGGAAAFAQVISQNVPEAATRANLVERGDADLAIDLQASDAMRLDGSDSVKVVSTPMTNSVSYVIFNNRMAPFNNENVRKAVAAALPYDDLFQGALFGRGRPLFGGEWPDGTAPGAGFPLVQPNSQDLDTARELLAEAGLPDGFATTFSYSVSQAAIAEPMAALIMEALGEIGIDVTIAKVPDAQMATMLAEKTVPFFTESNTAWLPSTDYWYRYSYTGDSRWNFSSLNAPELTRIANEARFERDQQRYDELATEMNTLAYEIMPVVPLWNANQDAVMAPSLEGYTYQFHRQVDFRDLSRGKTGTQ